jgi:hypothetical protein
VIGALVVAVALAACSGVPTGSGPHVVATIGGAVAPSGAAVVTPHPGADSREIVQGFLQENASEDAQHTAARSFLTPAAAKNWVDTFATVVDSLRIGEPDLITQAVTVTGNKLGTLDASGAYHPVTNSGTTGSPSPVSSWNLRVSQVNGQWRITNPPTGLLIDENEFGDTYKPHPVYFLDQTQKRLVPDLRYSPLDAQTLCTWLLDQLTAGPPQDLASANAITELPDQGPHPTVTFGQSAINVDIPGANQLDAQTKQRLAAQLAYTFSLNLTEFASQSISLTDGTKPVALAGVPGLFSEQSFPSFAPVAAAPSSTVYFVRNGVVVSHQGTPVGGQAGTSGADVGSVAIAHRGSATLIAATRGKAGHETLALGPLGGALTPADIGTGSLTRPAWAPGLDEVWIGDGSKLMRVPGVGARAAVVSLAQANGALSGQIDIEAVAFSPDGARVALVISTSNNSQGYSQVWVGTINRGAGGGNGPASVSIENLQAITPTSLVLSDVAWNDDSTLYTVGHVAGGFGIWSVQVDGSLLEPRPVTNLPGEPETITASQFGLAWVSVKTTVWEQGGPNNAWTAPGGGQGTAVGANPTYVE